MNRARQIEQYALAIYAGALVAFFIARGLGLIP